MDGPAFAFTCIALAVLAAGIVPVVRRLSRIGEAQPRQMCARCQADWRTWPLIVLALMPGCRDASCSTGKRPTTA